MPIANVQIGSTNSKTGTYQYTTKRTQALPLIIPEESGVTSCSNNRIVSIQQKDGIQYAVLYPAELSGYKLIGFGVLEEALQSGGLDSIAPSPNNFVDGDDVVVLRSSVDVYMIDVDGTNTPTEGLGTAYMNLDGKLTSSSAGDNRAIKGAVFSTVPGTQMSGQLKTGCLYFQMYSPVDP